MAMLGGVGRRALAGTANPEAKIASSDQPAAEQAMPKPKSLVEKVAGQKLVGRVKSIKLKIKMKDKSAT